jgi:hypothetical protein
MGMSALPPKADMCGAPSDVRFGSLAHIQLPIVSLNAAVLRYGPKADIACASNFDHLLFRPFGVSPTRLRQSGLCSGHCVENVPRNTYPPNPLKNRATPIVREHMIKIVTIEPTLVFSTNGCSFPWRGSKCQKAATLTAIRIIPKMIESMSLVLFGASVLLCPTKGSTTKNFLGWP